MDHLFEIVVENVSERWDLEDYLKEKLQSFADCFNPNMSVSDADHYLDSAVGNFLID